MLNCTEQTPARISRSAPGEIESAHERYPMKRQPYTWAVLALLALVGLTGVVSTVRAQSPALCADEVIVQPGDTLSTLATRYFGQPGGYAAIVTATNAAAAVDATYAAIANPDVLAVGWKLCIP